MAVNEYGSSTQNLVGGSGDVQRVNQSRLTIAKKMGSRSRVGKALPLLQ